MHTLDAASPMLKVAVSNCQMVMPGEDAKLTVTLITDMAIEVRRRASDTHSAGGPTLHHA